MTIPVRERVKYPSVPVRIRLEGPTVGPAPMWVSLSVEMPKFLRDGASILWTDNNKPIGSNSFSTHRLLKEPGNHHIRAMIIADDDRRITLDKTIKVLAATTRPAN